MNDRPSPRATLWARPLSIPPCPEGWRTGPPDFVGVGSQRCGSSWWYRAIEDHPAVVRAPEQRKELHYFDRFWDGSVPDDLASTYHRHFPRPEGSITGEWTPRYMHDVWSLALLREAAPDARILVILRDPVERFLSGFAREIRLARRAQVDLSLALIADAVARSLYHEQVGSVLRTFGRDRTLVLQLERCQADPAGEIARTRDFLGLEAPSDPSPALLATDKKREKPALPEPVRAELVERMRGDVERLGALCPELDLALWPDFAPG